MKNNKNSTEQGKKIIKKKKKISFRSLFLKIFVFFMIVGVGVLSYMIYSIKKETPTELIESYSPVSPSVIYNR